MEAAILRIGRRVKGSLSSKARFLVPLSRYSVAYLDSIRPAESYSQFGEDLEILKALEGTDLSGAIYIDVGANQPTRHSNTYLFYRNGMNGILIEPDALNAKLIQKFRPRDHVIQAVAGAESGIVTFHHSVFSVLSSVNELDPRKTLRKELVPQITIDEAARAVNAHRVAFMSIDTEGYELNVLKGSEDVLKKTHAVCVEHSWKDKDDILSFLTERGFVLLSENKRNLMLKNSLL